MDNYKKALDKAVEYIIENGDGCLKCINFKTCQNQADKLLRQGIEWQRPTESICRDSIRQWFINEAEADNGTK